MLIKPRTFLVGYTSVDEVGLRNYLNATGNEAFWEEYCQAKEEGLSTGECLRSFYAKLCYKSLSEGKNANITKTRPIADNLEAVFKSGHGCYDSETDVLTSEGWVNWPNVTPNMELATRTIDGVLEYHKPISLLIGEPYSGRMYRVEGQGVDLFVTPDHKMLACVTTTKRGRLRNDFELISASDLGQKSHAYIKTAKWCGDDDLPDDILAILGFAIGDGYVASNGSSVYFHLKRERKIAWLEAAAKACGWIFKSHPERDIYSVDIPEEHRFLFLEIYGPTREKQIPQKILVTQSEAGLKALFLGLMQSDGHYGETNDSFDTTSKKLHDQFQQLCLHIGLAANTCYVVDNDRRALSFGDKPLYRLSVIRRSLKPEVNRFLGSVGRSYWIEDWHGEIFCAEVPNNTLYVRRNGIPVWSGNSVFEHCWLNFVTTDCSRVLCFSEGVELLTSTGWKAVQNITTDDILLTKDPNTKLDEWSRPKSVRSFEYSGRMVNWSNSQGAAPAITDNHLLYAAQYDKRKFKGMQCDEIIEYANKIVASEVYGKRIVVGNSIKSKSPLDPEVIEIGGCTYNALDLFSWLGWMATDGGFDKNRPNQCTISQSKTKNWSELETLMTSLFSDRWRSHGPYETEDGITSRLFIISDSALADWARQMIGRNKMDRDLSPLFNYSPRLLNSFLDAAIAGDGNVHTSNGHEVIYTPSSKAAGHYQVLVSMVGKCAIVRVDDRTGSEHLLNSKVIYNRQPCFIVSISRKSSSLVKKKHWLSWAATNQRVYCPETENGLVFAREPTGLPVWTGNTHELVRHRVGTAFSQTSGRYCAIDQIDIVIPPELEGARGIVESFAKVAAFTCKELRDALIPEDADFATKKRITSAIRRLAPNGQTNEIGWSCNIRSMRHMIELRTSRHAEWEIRVVFNDVANIILERFPLMLYGHERIDTGDGLFEYTKLKV